MRDEGNYDGPLGTGRHVFHRSRFCEEPVSYVSEEGGVEVKGEGKAEERYVRDTVTQSQMGMEKCRESRL